MVPMTPAILTLAKLVEAALELVAEVAAEVADAAREVLDKALVVHPLQTIHVYPDVVPVEAAFVEPAPAGVVALVTLGVVAGPVAAGAVLVPPEKEAVWVTQPDAILCVRKFRSAGKL